MKVWKRFLSLLMTLSMVLTLLPISALASADLLSSGTCGSALTWTLTRDGTLTISGTGDMNDYVSSTPWYSYRNNVTSVQIEDGVTSIGKRAFYQCRNLQRVHIGESVAEIRKQAFIVCRNISEITVSDGNPAYCSVDGVLFDQDVKTLITYPPAKDDLSYTIPDGVTAIGEYAFQYSHILNRVEIPDSVTDIGGHGFSECSALTEVKIPDSVTSINGYAFYKCTSLREIAIPNHVTSIPNGAFLDCYSLCEVKIPDGVTTIEDGAFDGCIGLSSVNIPASVTTVGNGAFSYCDALAEVYFGGNAPSVSKTTDYHPSFLSGVVLYYPEGASGWTDSSAYDPAVGTWNGYKLESYTPSTPIVPDPSDTDGLKALHTDPILVNGTGQATAWFQLKDGAGVPREGQPIHYEINGNGLWQQAVTDGNGVFGVRLPPGESGSYTIECQIQEKDGAWKTVKETVSVKYTPLSYTQKWTGALGSGAGASIGPGVGGEMGAASVEADLIEAAAQGAVSGLFSMEDSYENGSRTMELTYTYDPSVTFEFKTGMAATLCDAQIRPIGASSGASLHGMTSYGVKIQNYDPANAAHLTQLGAFGMQSLLMGTGSVWGHTLLDWLDVGFHNQSAHTNQVVLEAGAAIGLIENEQYDKEFSLAAADGTVVYAVTKETDRAEQTTGKSAEWSADYGFGTLKNLLPGGEEDLLSCNGSNAVKLSVQWDQSEKLREMSLELYEGGKMDVFWGDVSVDAIKTVSYDKEQTDAISGEKEALRSFIEGDKWLLTPSQMADISAGVFAGDYLGTISNTTNRKVGTEVEIPLEVDAGKFGFEVNFSGSFVEETAFETEKGVLFNGREYITAQSFLTVNDVVAHKKNFDQIMLEPVKAVADTVAGYLHSAADDIMEGVTNFFATLQSANGGIYGVIKAFDAPTARSYAVLSIQDTGVEETNAAVAVTIGSPYTVNLYTDSTMETEITQAQAASAGVTLTLAYDSAMLASAGAPADADIHICRFDHQRNMYVCLPNCVQDKMAGTVSASITQGGEYILATDTASPLISDFGTSNETPTPTIYALVSDLSGIGVFRFWIDGQQDLVTTENFANYYDPVSGLFTYPVKSKLADGQHTAYFQAADTLGNANGDPFVFTFQVDGKAPVISDVAVPSGTVSEGFAVTATVADDREISQVILMTETENGETGNLTMTQENGTWTAQVTDVAGAGTISLRVIAYDFAGNRSESRAYTVRSSVPADPTGIVLSADWTGAGTADVTVSNHEQGAFGGWLLCGVYDEDGRMLDLANLYVGLSGKESITESVSFNCDLSAIHSGKVMLLDVGDGYAPICEIGLF